MLKFREFNSKNSSNYKEVLKQLQEPISIQICELRSTVVMEVCTLLQSIVETMRDEFEPFAEHFIPSLLKTTFVTKKAISDPGNACIVHILQYSRIGRGLVDICEPLGTRKSASVLRKRCIEYLGVYLSVQKTNYLEYYLNSIESGLRNALACEVRDCGKKAFQDYARHWPDRVNRFLGTLDLTTQQYMKKGGVTPIVSSFPKVERVVTVSVPIKKKIPVEDVMDEEKCIEIKPIVPRKPSPEIVFKKVDSASQMVTKREVIKESPKISDVSIFLKSATSTDANVRRENLFFLSSILNKKTEILPNFSSILSVLTDALNDDDTVCSVAITTLCDVILAYPKEFEPSLKTFLPYACMYPKISERFIASYPSQNIAQEYFLLLANGLLTDDSIEFLLRLISMTNGNEIIEYCMEVLYEIEKDGINSLATQLLIVIQKNYSTVFRQVLDTNEEMGRLFMDLSIVEDEAPEDESTRELSKHFTDFQTKLMQNAQDEIQIVLNDIELQVTTLKLDKLTKLSEQNHTLWHTYFNRTLLLVLDIITKNPCDDIKEYGLLLLNCMLKHQKNLFTNSECLILPHIVDMSKSKFLKVSLEARNTGVTFLEYLEAEKTAPILLELIKKTENQAIGFELLETFAHRIPRDLIRDYMAVLIGSIENVSIEVRKNAIFCLVKISCVLGDDFWAYFKTFDSKQIKLVRHWIQKTVQ
jgi:hypothetical protein